MHFNLRQSGMTLLELLVVMVLLGLVSTLLMQGFGTALSTYERVQRHQLASIPALLSEQWLRDSVAGVQAELDPPRQFKGDGKTLSGWSHRPLVGVAGSVQPISWSLEPDAGNGLQLVYRQGKVRWPLLHWPQGSQGQFIYRDHLGGGHEAWPPKEQLANLTPDGRIPAAIRLEVTLPQGDPLRWYIQLPGRTYPRGDYRDL